MLMEDNLKGFKMVLHERLDLEQLFWQFPLSFLLCSPSQTSSPALTSARVANHLHSTAKSRC